MIHVQSCVKGWHILLVPQNIDVWLRAIIPFISEFNEEMRVNLYILFLYTLCQIKKLLQDRQGFQACFISIFINTEIRSKFTCFLFVNVKGPQDIIEIDNFGAKFSIFPMLKERFDVSINMSWDLMSFFIFIIHRWFQVIHSIQHLF